MKKTFTPADILPPALYEQQRPQKRQEVMQLKAQRRVHVGPYAVFLFENETTLKWQIQEMLRIEKGGEAHMEEELGAYNPLLPQGSELMATLMLEISNVAKRKALLSQLGHLEHTIFLAFGEESIQAHSIDAQERTDEEGKTSSVHFLCFPFNAGQKTMFLKAYPSPSLQITHPVYSHQALLTEAVYQQLRQDFEE